MRLCVVAPSQGYLGLAGVRIRYDRLIERLRMRGIEVAIRVIDDLRRSSFAEHDLFLISKVYDARALLLTRMVVASGRRVGVDLFDDYFSHVGDSRFIHHRGWMRELARHVSFVLCSTPRMAEVAAAFMPATPAHVLNDPFAAFDAERIARLVEANVAATRATRRLRIGWFGTGDNKYFPVGLDDVHAFREALAPWRRHGYEAELSILTNARALTPDRLGLLRALPVPHRIEEWSEEREAAQIAESLFCFLPTNAQNFSAAKSMNRAVTALTGGSQAFSVGYPLYAPLGEFIYRSAEDLLRDVEAGTPAVRQASLPALAKRLSECADPGVEAEGLANFLRKLPSSKRPRSSPPVGSDAVVHGLRSSGGTHKLAQRLAQFSVGVPFGSDKFNHDLRFVLDPSGTALGMEVSEGVLATLAPMLRERFEMLPEPRGKRTHLLAALSRDPWLTALLRYVADSSVPGAIIAFYPKLMSALVAELERLMPGIRCLISEGDPLFSREMILSGEAPALAAEEGQRAHAV